MTRCQRHSGVPNEREKIKVESGTEVGGGADSGGRGGEVTCESVTASRYPKEITWDDAAEYESVIHEKQPATTAASHRDSESND